MTEKRGLAEKDKVPECEHGYWGGFSPKRKGRYEDQNLAKQYQNGRARIFPNGGSRYHRGSLKKVSPHRDGQKSDKEEVDRGSPISVFKVSNTNEKANFEIEKMRMESNAMAGPSDNLLTENQTISAVDKNSTSHD